MAALWQTVGCQQLELLGRGLGCGQHCHQSETGSSLSSMHTGLAHCAGRPVVQAETQRPSPPIPLLDGSIRPDGRQTVSA